MDLLLLAAGAVVLIGITLWIVWPARSADIVGNSVQGEEASARPMADTVPSAMPPQGDRFEDQYTSATADLSAGAVAAALESMQAEPQTPPPPAPRPAGYANLPGTTLTTPALPAPSRTTMLLARKRSIGLGAGALLAVSGGVGGAYVYARWQRERNKPINRLRRGARQVAGRLGERMPDVDDLPQAAPMSGAATALLLTALVAGRTLRRGSDADDPTQDVRAQLRSRGGDALRRGRKESDRLRARLPADALDAEERPFIMRIGVGGMALIAGGAFFLWRRLRRRQPDRPTWYAGE
jgi:hypothetical protein